MSKLELDQPKEIPWVLHAWGIGTLLGYRLTFIPVLLKNGNTVMARLMTCVEHKVMKNTRKLFEFVMPLIDVDTVLEVRTCQLPLAHSLASV